MTDKRNYTITMRTGADGAQYVRIREAPPERRETRPAADERASGDNFGLLKAGFHKALRLVSRSPR